MRSRVGSRLPAFSSSESALLKGSLDFVGINHYTTYYGSKDTSSTIGRLLNDSLSDSGAITLRKYPFLSVSGSFGCLGCLVGGTKYYLCCCFQLLKMGFSIQLETGYVSSQYSKETFNLFKAMKIKNQFQMIAHDVFLAKHDFSLFNHSSDYNYHAHVDLQANSIWLYIVPQGMRSLMNYIKTKYGNPLVIITENGKSLNSSRNDERQ